MAVEVGHQLGRYRIEAKLGHGGMAEVFRATDLQLERKVAIKVILPMFTSDSQALARFQREARTIAALEHPYILPIYDFGDDQGLPYLVMPLIENGTLGDRLNGEPLPPRQALIWLRELAEALDAAHSAGILHRDIKPANVLIGRQDHVYLADFGIAKLGEATTRLTRTGMIVGTPLYMAPEVAGGEDATAAADRYSLAVMAYEMLTGRPPFAGENVLSILHQHATKPVPPATEQAAHLPPDIDMTLAQGLAKEPSERPTSCTEFIEALRLQLASNESDLLPPLDSLPTLALPATSGTTPAPPRARSASLRSVAGTPVSAAATSTSQRSAGQTSAGQPSAGQPSIAMATPSAGSRQGVWVLGGLAVAVGLALWLTHKPAPPASPPQHPAGSSAAPSGSPPTAPAPPAPAFPQPTAAHPGLREPVPGADAPAVAAPSSGDEAGDPARPPDDLGASASPPGGSTDFVPAELSTEPESARRLRPGDALRQGGSRSRPEFADARTDAFPGGKLRELWLNPRFDELRNLEQRMSAEHFTQLLATAQQVADLHPAYTPATLLQNFARGGLAYLEGDAQAAGKTLQDLARNPQGAQIWSTGPLLLLRQSPRMAAGFTGWEVALGYGDPLRQAGAALSPELATAGADPYLLTSRALLHRLDHQSADSFKTAARAWEGASSTGQRELAAYAAWLAGSAAAERSQPAEAWTWLKRAAANPSPATAGLVFAIARQALRNNHPDEAGRLLQDACAAGFLPACEMAKRQGRPRRPL